MRPNISVVDFVRTYEPSYSLAYLDYHGKLESMIGTEPYPEISPSLSDTNSTHRKSIQAGKNVPKPVRGIEGLAQIGIEFPFYYDNKLFPQLMALYSACLFSGYIDDNYYYTIECKNQLMETILTGFRFRHNKSNELFVPATNGNAIGRLLVLLGLPHGTRKSEVQLNINPVMALIRGMQQCKLTKEQQRVYESALQNFGLCYFLNRLVIKNDKRAYAYLPVNASRRRAAKFAQQMTSALSFIYGTDFDYSISTRASDKKEGHNLQYEAKKHLSKKRLQEINIRLDALVEMFNVSSNV